MTMKKERKIKRLLPILLSFLGPLSSPIMAQMPSPLLLGVEPSIPTEIWDKYEAQIQDAIFCKSPLVLTTSQIYELAIEWDQAGNTSIVPPRSFRVLGFQVQHIQVQLTDLDSHQYHSTGVVATMPVWNAVTDHLIPPGMIAAQSDAAAVLKLTCPPS